MGHRQHRQGQAAGRGQAPVKGLGRGRGGGVVDARHPLGEQHPHPGQEVLLPPIRILVGGQRLGVRLRPRPFHQHAGRFPAGVPLDHAAVGVGGVAPDAEHLQPPGADDAHVEAEVGDDDRPVEPEGVEVRSVELPRPVARPFPAHSPNPLGVRFPGRLLPQDPAQVVDVGGGGEIRPARVERRQAQVAVGVDEPGHDDAPAQIHHLTPGPAADDLTVADGHHAVAELQRSKSC